MVAGHLTLKNGRYYAVLNYKNAGGQRKTKWISLGLSEKGNKRKAESELARLRAEFEPPKEVGDLSSDMLFADYLLEWLEIAKGRLAHATYGAYQGLLKSTIVPYFRKKKLTLRELEARHLQMFYSEMLRRVTPNTVIHYHAVIHSALKYAVKTDMLIQNVADKVDRPRKNSFQPVFLSAEEMQKMFEALRGTKLELPVLVAAFYGLRRGEVVGLKWDAIDFEQGTISVKRTVTSTIIDGKYQEFEQQSAKTKSSLRTLPLIGSFREYFMQVKEAQELNKQVCGNCYNYEYDGFVFVDELGERMRVEYLTNAFPKFLESHGLRRMRFHDLRHSCASLLLANGVPLKHIQEWLGHSDFTTTANIYAHLDYKSKITSAQAMETGLALPEGGDFSSRWGVDRCRGELLIFSPENRRSCRLILWAKIKKPVIGVITGFLWRRVRDSNPRFLLGTRHFECRTFDLSDNSPYTSSVILAPEECKKNTQEQYEIVKSEPAQSPVRRTFSADETAGASKNSESVPL